MTGLSAVVLAAGLGKRMGGGVPKVLIEARGRRLLDRVVDVLRAAGAERIVVVEGPSAPRPSEMLSAPDLSFVVQSERLGTAHALAQAEPILRDETGPFLVVHGDMPLMKSASLRALLSASETASSYAALLVARPAPGDTDAFAGLGRVVVKEGVVREMVEARDLPSRRDALLAIDPDLDRAPTINIGAYLFGGTRAPGQPWRALGRVGSGNAQGEHYLPDAIGILAAEGLATVAVPGGAEEGLGVNTPADLARVEAILRSRDAAGSSSSPSR